jgi:hypothetical protein
MSFTAKERKFMTGAFQRAWKTLLKERRVTVGNIEQVPTMLLAAIVDAARNGERDETLLAQAAIHKIAVYEQDQLERVWRSSSNLKSSSLKRLH